MKQNAKFAVILLTAFIIPSMIFASGNAEGSEGREFSEHKDGSGKHWHGRGRWGGRRGLGRMGFLLDDDFLGGYGTYISGIVEGSPAEAAGLQEGDGILAFNGETEFELQESIQALSPGDSVTLTIARRPEEGGEQLIPVQVDLSLTLGANDEGLAYAGIQYIPSRGMRGARGFYNFDFDAEDLERIEEFREEIQEFLEEERLENSSL